MKILAGNWKLHKTRVEVKEFFSKVKGKLPTSSASDLRFIVAPSPCLLESTLGAAQNSGIQVFAQNVHWEKKGAFTGECSAPQLRELGCAGSLVGHSERRQYFGDTDETVTGRARALSSEGLAVIYCIGEKLSDREANKTEAVLEAQLQGPLKLLKENPKLDQLSFILAYEPVWAIGTGLTASSEQIKQAHQFIGRVFEKAGLWVPSILYGGSVKTNNFKEICQLPGVAGGLVGGASLEPSDYAELAGHL